MMRVDVDLLYEKLPAYCFMCECFDHVDLGCHLYSGGVIGAFIAPYGSWLQVEIKRTTRRNLQGRCFGLGEDDLFMEFDDDKPLANGPSSSSSAARIDEPMLLSEFRDSPLDRDNLIGINSRVDVSPFILGLNLALNTYTGGTP
ncbi:hypothetical protein ACFX11_006824 [Malus domestica]